MPDLNEFIEWSKNNPGCSVKIEIGGLWNNDAGAIRGIWVYNNILGTGQHVSSVDEINLEVEYEKSMERKKQEVEKYFQNKKEARYC